jgi:hypothetical protein
MADKKEEAKKALETYKEAQKAAEEAAKKKK